VRSRGDEQDAAEIELHQIVVAEGLVLSGSSTSRRADDGSPRKSAAELVQLVEHGRPG